MYLVLSFLLGLFIGFRGENEVIRNQRKKLLRRAAIITKQESQLVMYRQFVPKTEALKEEIIKLHFQGVNGRKIGKILGIDSSAITRALKRWNIK